MTFTGLVYDVAVLLTICLAALELGYWTLRLLRVEGRGVEVLWLAVTCGLGMLSIATMLIGAAGLLYRELFIVLLTPLAVAGGLLLVIRFDWWREVRRALAWGDGERPLRLYTYLLLVISAGVILWVALTYALMPPYAWDEIIYHLTLPKLYVRAHSLAYIPYVCLSLWPMNNEMLFTIALLLGSDIAPHLLVLGMTLWTGLGLLIVASRHFDTRVGVVAVALFLTVPIVKQIAGTGLIDIPIGLYLLAALAALNNWQQRQSWPSLVLCGALCGFAAGSKLTGGAVPILLGLLILADELRRRPLQIRAMLSSGALFSLTVLLVAGPWYLRSFHLTGNPIWPLAYDVFGGRDWDMIGNEYFMGTRRLISLDLGRTPDGLLQSFLYLLTRPQEMGPYRGGIGVVIPLGTLCASILALRGPRFLRQILFVAAGFYLLWFVFVPLELRYLIPIVPLLSLASAYLFVWLYDRIRLRPLRLALGVGLLVLVLHEWPWVSAGDRQLLASRLPYLLGQIPQEAWLDTQLDIMPVFSYANAQLPDDAKILLLPYENRTYYLDRDYIWGCLTCQSVIRFEDFSTAADLANKLQTMGVTHVIDNPSYFKYDRLRYWQHDRKLMLALQDKCGQPLYQHGEAVLYALKECTRGTGVSEQP